MGIGDDRMLVIMAKAPRAEHVKTRLLGRYSQEAVIAIYRALVEDTLEMARSLPGMRLSIMCPAGDGEALGSWLSAVSIEEQQGIGLADALSTTFTIFGARGFRRVIALNCDTPHLPARRIEEAFNILATRQLVVGPTLDGGYYLVGAASAQPALFEAASLGTGSAREALVARAAQLGLDVGYTSPCYDVDLPEDLDRLRGELAQFPERAPRTAAWLTHSRSHRP